jgi:centrosomal protein CEP104
MEKLGDNNARNKEQAENAMKMLADHPSVQPAIVVQHLIKGNTSKPKLDNSLKHISGRLFMLTELIKTFGINNQNMAYQPIVDFTLKYLDH